MNRVELHNEPYSDGSGRRTLRPMGSVRFPACAVVILMAATALFVLADALVYGYVGPTGLVNPTNVPTDECVTAVRRKARYSPSPNTP